MQKLSALVKDRAGLRTEREAKRALVAAVGALRCVLDDEDARSLAAALRPAMGSVLERPRAAQVDDLGAFYAEAERRERVGLGFAMEHAQAVMQVLAERLDPELVARLHVRIPSDIATLLTARPLPADPPPHLHVHPPRAPTPLQTLSRSKPGSAEPIAEARHALAHEESVARTGSPHAGEEVATARSPRASREDETLSGSRGNVERK
ncbi:MAG TPA: DUF2267 domain-containing protein [Polyangiaceae bacterium]|nr:DUF2267 domain-containing protein [Polyangiaceae bacterium]